METLNSKPNTSAAALPLQEVPSSYLTPPPFLFSTNFYEMCNLLEENYIANKIQVQVS
jgi:hypothetical protein